jgi:oxygen-dependent protoporphyrinogen oxidase
VTGLAAAWLIRERFRDQGRELAIRVLEADAVAGGTMRTDLVDGFRVEWGPNGFLDHEPAMLRFVDELGLRDQLLPANASSARRFLLHRGRPILLPSSPGAFFRSPLLGAGAKASLLAEPFRPRYGGSEEETVASFVRRRLGPEFVSRLVEPMVTGIFAGDVERLSLDAAFPRLRALEREHGSLLRGMVARGRELRRARRRGDPVPSGGPAGPGGHLTSFREGMGQLVSTLTDSLGDALITRAPVVALLPRDDGAFEITYRVGDPGRRDLGSLFARAVARRQGERSLIADVVVSALPAGALAPLLAPWRPDEASRIAGVPVAPVAVVALGFDRAQVRHPLDGFGMLIPREEGIRTLGALWTSSLFPHRAPEGMVLLRCMIGGALDRTVADDPESSLLATVVGEMGAVLGFEGPPRMTRVYRHRKGIPQYEVGHLDRVAAADRLEAEVPGLFITGNSLRGVAVNACVKDATRVADRVSAPARRRSRR